MFMRKIVLGVILLGTGYCGDFRDSLSAEFPHPPSFHSPSSQLCTFEQFQTPEYAHWLEELKLTPLFHRKYWEWCYILQVLEGQGKLRSGCRGLGFGVGKEPLASVFAKHGCFVTATDQSMALAEQSGWACCSEGPAQLKELHFPDICSVEDFFSHVSYEEADMNAIPEHFRDFDFTWSSCSLEHLGNIQNGLRFILNSLRCLKKGGIAVHTTEFNLSSNGATVSQGPTVLFRKQDIDSLIRAITAEGHTVLPINLHPGIAPLDQYIDYPPYSRFGHLKLALLGHISTSFGIIVIKN
jgi:SAM-dependent methyltransferase